MTNSYFLCVTQPLNAGDLLINRMLIEELSNYGKVYVDCYNCPDDFRSFLIGNSDNIVDVYRIHGFSLKQGNVISFARFVKMNAIKLYTQSPGPLNKKKKLTLRFSFWLIRETLKRLHVPFVRIGSCCSAAVATNTNVVESKDVCYYVRSKNAVEFLRQFKNDRVHYIPDLAFLYKKYAHTCLKQKIAVFSFRSVDDNLDQFIKWLKDNIRLLRSDGYHIVFYHQVKNDGDFMNYLYKKIGDSNIEMISDVIWYDKFDFYADKEFVFSNRLHCLLMGTIYNAIPYAYVDKGKLVQKIKDVFESSFGDSYVDYIADSLSTEKLHALIENLSIHQSRISDITSYNELLCQNTIRKIVGSYEK